MIFKPSNHLLNPGPIPPLVSLPFPPMTAIVTPSSAHARPHHRPPAPLSSCLDGKGGRDPRPRWCVVSMNGEEGGSTQTPRGSPYEAVVAHRRIGELFDNVVDISAYANRHAFGLRPPRLVGSIASATTWVPKSAGASLSSTSPTCAMSAATTTALAQISRSTFASSTSASARRRFPACTPSRETSASATGSASSPATASTRRLRGSCSPSRSHTASV